MYLTLSRINCDPDDPEDRVFKIAWRKKFQIIRKIDEALSVNSAIETGCAVFLSSRIRHYPPWGLITHSDRVESENAVLSLLLESFRLIKRTGNAVEIGLRIMDAYKSNETCTDPSGSRCKMQVHQSEKI